MNSIPSTLNQKPLQIRFLRLKSGENILATLIKEDETAYIVTNPVLSIHFVNPVNGAVGYGSYPWAPHPSLMHLHYTIKKESVIVSAEIPPEYRSYTMVVESFKSYNAEENFGSEPIEESNIQDEQEALEENEEMESWFDKTKRVLH